MKLTWTYQGTPADPGHWQSKDGRFRIRPEYYGSTRAQSYELMDGKTRVRTSCDTVRLAKYEAEAILRREGR